MSDVPVRTRGYLPIASYGLIGDCRSAALVGCDGSIDWCCLPRFDDASIFGRLLDSRRGGHWKICPADGYVVTQRYRDRSNLLCTTFQTASGRLLVTDFMPVAERSMTLHARPHPGARVVRLVECIAGTVRVRQELVPRPDYGRQRSGFEADDSRFHGDTEFLHVCIQSTASISGARSTFTLHAGEARAFALRTSGRGHCTGSKTWTLGRARGLLRETQHYWWRWIDRCRYTGPYQEPVWRSALALKLMAYAPSGAIIAAPTTSLPERIGGERNWDYRFTWLRDASFTLYAFFQVGMHDEAAAFYHWLIDASIHQYGAQVPNLYTVTGDGDVTEGELRHLSGYQDSAPVRVGNGAVLQLQLDVYGELLDSAYLYARFGGQIGRGLWRELHTVVENAITEWDRPDASIWESRGGEQHYTYSKMMCWVAVDRGIRIADRFRHPYDRDRWHRARSIIHRRITALGWNPRRHAFTQTLGGDTLDAAMLRLTQTRFLPDRDPRLRSTIRAIDRDLGSGVLVHRYHTGETPDGLTGHEGAFLMCSFWLVDALAHIGELEEAEQRFERLLGFGSGTGLFSEEVDATTGALLGNYPQAFTHLALIGAAVNIERARHKHLGVEGLGSRLPAPPPRIPTHVRRRRQRR